MTIGESMKKFRESEKLSQTALGKILEINQVNISRWESGTNIPSVVDCWKLASYYRITIDELVGREMENESVT